MNVPNLKLVSREEVERVARVLGDESASAKALKQAERQTQAGCEVDFIQYRNVLLVVSRKPE